MTTAATIRRSRAGAPHAADMIRNRRPFHAHALTGSTCTDSLGSLPEPIRADFLAAERAGRVLYVVRSYDTPIAWHLDGGEWVLPFVQYSPTTTKHQTATRSALLGERVTEYPAKRIRAGVRSPYPFGCVTRH